MYSEGRQPSLCFSNRPIPHEFLACLDGAIHYAVTAAPLWLWREPNVFRTRPATSPGFSSLQALWGGVETADRG